MSCEGEADRSRGGQPKIRPSLRVLAGARVRRERAGLQQQGRVSASTVPSGRKPAAGGGRGGNQALGLQSLCPAFFSVFVQQDCEGARRALGGKCAVCRWVSPSAPLGSVRCEAHSDSRGPVRFSHFCHLEAPSPAQRAFPARGPSGAHPTPPPPAPKQASHGETVSQPREFGNSFSRA